MPSGPEYLDEIKAKLEAGGRQWKRGDILLRNFGYVRRRQSAIDWMNDELESRGMRTSPALSTDMPLDGFISFSLVGSTSEPSALGTATPGDVPADTPGEDAGGHPAEQPPESVVTEQEEEALRPDAGTPADLAVKIANLAAAERLPLRIDRDAELTKALTEMTLKDYSQLVVASSEYKVQGIVSFKSIARAYLWNKSPKYVRDCIDDTVPHVSIDDPLLDVIRRFEAHDAVLVFRNEALCGIVTPADISVEFAAMVSPFLLLGEVERHLRWLVETRLTPHGVTLETAAGTVATTVKDLSLGDLQYLLQDPAKWNKLRIPLDRGSFCGELEHVRQLRNAVMHFGDPLHPDEVTRIRRLAELLRETCAALAAAT